MAHLTAEQLEHLQTLSNIKLSSSEQEDFLQKLDPVIAKLEELWSVDISSDRKLENVFEPSCAVTLRTLDSSFDGPKQKEIADNIMKNVEHEVINNSVVIKSVL